MVAKLNTKTMTPTPKQIEEARKFAEQEFPTHIEVMPTEIDRCVRFAAMYLQHQIEQGKMKPTSNNWEE